MWRPLRSARPSTLFGIVREAKSSTLPMPPWGSRAIAIAGHHCRD
jgi:hypothetical protein